MAGVVPDNWREILEACGGSISEAARHLGCSRQALYNRQNAARKEAAKAAEADAAQTTPVPVPAPAPEPAPAEKEVAPKPPEVPEAPKASRAPRARKAKPEPTPKAEKPVKEKKPAKRRWSLEQVEEKLFELIENGDFRAISFYLSTKGKRHGYYPVKAQAPPIENKEVGIEILRRLKREEITPMEAGLEFEIAGIPIPDTLRLMITKSEPVPHEPANSDYSIFTSEEFRERLSKRSAQISEQLGGLEQRREEIRELRTNVADSFGIATEDFGHGPNA